MTGRRPGCLIFERFWRWTAVPAWMGGMCWLASCGTLSSDRTGLFGDGSGGSGSSNGPAPAIPGPSPFGNYNPGPGPNGASGATARDPDDGARAPTDAGAEAADAGGRDLVDAANPVPPCVGSALSLDGSNYASIPRLVSDDFTLEAWIQTTTSRTASGAFYSRPVFDSDVVGGNGMNDFIAGILDDRYVFGAGNPDTTVTGASTVTTGEWVHVAVTRRAATGEVRIIVNGSLDAAEVLPNVNSLTSAPSISLGGAIDERHFIGLIDEVRIWTVVRSVDEIAASLHARLNGSEPGLVGYYPFEDLAPDQTADLSRSAQPATLVGATYATSTALCPAL